jgi:hypothetical protein
MEEDMAAFVFLETFTLDAFLTVMFFVFIAAVVTSIYKIRTVDKKDRGLAITGLLVSAFMLVWVVALYQVTWVNKYAADTSACRDWQSQYMQTHAVGNTSAADARASLIETQPDGCPIPP